MQSRLGAVAPTQVLSVPAGEKAKTIETLDRLAENAIRGGVTRNSVVVALGAVLALTGPGRPALDPVVGWNGGTAYGPLFPGVGVVAGCAALPLLRGGPSAPAGG